MVAHTITVKNLKNQIKLWKGCIIMKQLISSTRKKAVEKERTAMLRLEMDYELSTLFEAMTENNEDKKKNCKQRLEKIRQELLRLKAL